MELPIYQLVYSSVLAPTYMIKHDLTAEQIVNDILEVSLQRNKENDVTGLLLFYRTSFVQLLEGPEKNVKSIFNSILKDKRHSSITLVTESPVEARTFPTWRMGYKTIDQIDRLPELYDLWNDINTVLLSDARRWTHAQVVDVIETLIRHFNNETVDIDV